MSILSKAPLIEVIFELRWGKVNKNPRDGTINIDFTNEVENKFADQFKTIVQSKGFPIFEKIHQNLPAGLPHVITRRYRKNQNNWPCYQTGVGIFTVNQANEGYKWKVFQQDILNGLAMLDEAYPSNLKSLSVIGTELRYQDGFYMGEGESAINFLKHKMAFNFSIPENFLEKKELVPNIDGNNIGFTLDVLNPKGKLTFKLNQALINGRPGFVMETIVRSADEDKPKLDMDSLENWVQEAHKIQKHAFNTLIQPKYMGTFK